MSGIFLVMFNSPSLAVVSEGSFSEKPLGDFAFSG